ncbi:hypothetical protein M8J76_006806 [Diaphorina citri]|nr:hypothetical protein M8J76_006806 [Diaphorina citri]
MLGVIKLNGPAINVFGPNGGPSSSNHEDQRDVNQRPPDQEDHLGDDHPTNPSAVLLAAVSYQCAATWRWLRSLAGREGESSNDCDEESVKQSTMRISHSLPDLHPDHLSETYVPDKSSKDKVLRQTTLPSVPTRHQTFQRQLSHRLDLEPVQFSICRLPSREQAIGIIKPELYSKEMLRQNSTDSSDNADMEYSGKLNFALKYDFEMDALIVKILEAHDLPIKDVTGSSDPYVKVYLLPDRKKKFQTKVHRKNLNPVFNETFIFNVSYEDLRRRYLQFSVYDFDRFSRHDLIGQVVVKGILDMTDLRQEIEFTMNILSTHQVEKIDLGELMVSLCYLPKAGRLTVTIIKGRNLKAMDITGASDPYVKVYLVCEGKRIRKKRTSVKKNSLNPFYNEALLFDVPASNVNDDWFRRAHGVHRHWLQLHRYRARSLAGNAGQSSTAGHPMVSPHGDSPWADSPVPFFQLTFQLVLLERKVIFIDFVVL